MDDKDREFLKGELKRQYDGISKTDFWIDFIGRMDDERKMASRHCEVDDSEEVAKWQGFIRGIDAVKRLPGEVLAVTPRKSF